MKAVRIAILLILVLVVPGYAFSAGLGYMRVSLQRGDVQVKTQETGEWSIAPVNLPLSEGDEVWVPPGGRAELQLNSGTYLRIDENSSLQILSLERDASQFYLPQGRVYVNYNSRRGDILQIDTPDSSTRAFSSATFGVDVPDSFTEIAVYRGEVETENTVGKVTIVAGQVVALGEDSYGEIAPLGLASDWEDWNRTRDRRLLARRSVRYLPPELAVYAPDFDSSGRWVSAADYGYVWTPTPVDPNWSPYSEGRWIWRDGEYVWLPYESWGWAPYHYGRWAFLARIGWCWVPPARGESYWGPGYVGWVRTPEYVAWVPLAPGETYYGRGYYGPHSVNVTNVNVTQVNVNVYKNVYVNRGVKVVTRDSFSTATPARVNVSPTVVQRNIFTRSNISVAGPDIKPTRASSLPSARAVAPAKLPPARIRNLKVQETREARPLVRDASKPVLASRPVKLPVNVSSSPRTLGKSRPSLRPATVPGTATQPAAPAAPAAPAKKTRASALPARRSAAAPAARATAPAVPAAPATPGARAPAPVAPAVPATAAPRHERPGSAHRAPAARPQVPPAVPPTRPAAKPEAPAVAPQVRPEQGGKPETAPPKLERHDRRKAPEPLTPKPQPKANPAPESAAPAAPAPIVEPRSRPERRRPAAPEHAAPGEERRGPPVTREQPAVRPPAPVVPAQKVERPQPPAPPKKVEVPPVPKQAPAPVHRPPEHRPGPPEKEEKPEHGPHEPH